MNRYSQSPFCFIIVFSLLFFSCQPEEKKQEISKIHAVINDQKPALDSLLDYYVDEDFYPFVYARLENIDGSLLYEHGQQNANLLPNTTINKDTWIRIWSMSKIVTITLALDLIEEGLLHFDDPVTKFIPEFKNLQVARANDGSPLTNVNLSTLENICPLQLVPNDSVMTILHLLNHQAGFYYATTGLECLDSMLAEKNIATSKNNKDFIDRLASLPLIQQPGESDYYGINTTVLGFVAERASGKSLKQLVDDKLGKGLKIAGLQYGIPDGTTLIPKFTGRDSMLRKAKRGELDIFGPDVPDYDPDHELYLGGEGMLATADGYADFVRMLVQHGSLNGNRFLEKETVEDIYAPHSQLDNPYGYNGYNLWVSGDSMRLKGLGDAGLWLGGGYECTHFWADPKRNFVGVIMSQNNQVKSPGYEMNDKFKGLLYKALFEIE